MQPSNTVKPFLARPVSPHFITQRFGEYGACINAAGKTIEAKKGVCPAGSRSIYPPGGHTGLDLAAKMWVPVYASQDGIVEEVQTEEARGLGVGVVTDQKFYFSETGTYEHAKYRNWHFQQIDVQLGDRVKTGDLLGLAGKTGYATGVHDHVEVKPVRQNANGTWYNILQDNGTYGAVNPEPYMLKLYALTTAGYLRQLREATAILMGMLADLARYGKTY